MSTAVLNEIVEKVAVLTRAERRELFKLLQEEESKVESNGKKGFVHPNTIWIKENHTEYQGRYVAVDDGKLVGTGENFPEALAEAKKSGSEKPMITYLFPLDSEPFGGW